jgi:hypothetical protein
VRVETGVVREDFVELEPAIRTDEGYFRFKGFAAKPGVMVYVIDGREVRVLVPPETLHDKASLDTLVLKPLTLGHPDPDMYPDQVTPYNERDLSVGSVGESVEIRRDGRVAFSNVVRSAHAIQAIEQMQAEGKILGLSPGYRCDEECSPGVHPEYGAYDRIQRNRRYNHLAITDSPRGGPRVHFRIDDTSTETPETPMKQAMIESLVALGMSREDATNAVEDEATALEAVKAQVQARADEAEAARVAQDEADEAEAAKAVEAAEAAKAARVEARKARRALDAMAGEYKVDADNFDDADLKAAILKAAGVSVPRRDGLDETIATEVCYEVFLASRKTVKADGADPVKDAFTFDPNPFRQDEVAPVDLGRVYAPKA